MNGAARPSRTSDRLQRLLRTWVAVLALLSVSTAAADAAQPGDVGWASDSITVAAVPDPPTNPIARAVSATSVRLSWSPGADGGQPFTDWIASYSSDGGATWTTFEDGISPAPIITVTGLTAGETYGFRIVGVTAGGTSRPVVVSTARITAGALAAGDQHLCAITVDGSVVCWGSNASGQFGIGTTAATVSEPAANDPSAARAVSLSAGTGFTCYLDADGAARCAGAGTSGQLGNNQSANSTSYVAVQGMTGATRIVSGSNHTCAILSNRTISCWGQNDYLQAAATAGNKPSATPYAGPTGVVDLALGFRHTCVLLDGGEVKCWGFANAANPAIGNGATASVTAPATVETSPGVALADITRISARNYTTCAVRGSDDTVWCWGLNSTGQVGDGTTTAASRATQVVGLVDAVDVAVGTASACAVLASGRTRCWGANDRYQIGDGVATTTARPSPVEAVGITSAVAVVATEKTVCARLAARTISCWGRADSGQLGSGTTTDASSAVAVRSLISPLAAPIRPSSPSGVTLAARTGTSMTIAWTAPEYDGGSAITDYVIEYAVAGSTTWTTVADGTSTERRATIAGLLPNVEYNVRVAAVNAQGAGDPKSMQQSASRVAQGSGFGCALLVNATVACWGINTYGQLGNATTSASASPRLQAVTGLAGVTQIAAGREHACAIAGSAKQVSCWGRNNVGQLGIGTTTDVSSPRAVAGMTDVAQIAALEYTTCARKTTGSVWCWGEGSNGQIGNGSASDRTTPAEVSGISTAASIAVGVIHACAVLSNGEVRCWGDGGNGRLGNGATTQQTSPVAVSGITTATAVVAGTAFSCARLIDGTVACWGLNNVGQLADGTTTDRTTPVSTLGIAGATQVFAGTSHACALMPGGAVYCWGQNNVGQLGEGAATGYRTLPVAVTAGVAFTSLSGSRTSTCGTVDGATQMCWGENTSFRLGDATQVTRFAPVSLVKTTLLPVLPDPPMLPTADWRNADTIDIAWGPGLDRGAAITDYLVEYTRDGGATWTTLDDGVSTTPSASLTGAARGTYSFRVSAVNANGTSLPASTAAAVQIAGGTTHTCAVLEDGGVSCWGSGANGRLGTLATENRASPTMLVRTGRATQIDAEVDHTCARIADGTVRCWGAGQYGRLGNGAETDSSEPVQVSGITTATQVATGSLHSCALLANGTVRCWGRGDLGSLGDRTTASSTTPVVVKADAGGEPLAGVTQIAAGRNATCALITGGTVRCWGLQTTGRLGNGLTASANVLTPTEVLTADATPLTGVTRISMHEANACAVLANNTVRCWGEGSSNQIGDNLSTARAYATEVASITTATDVQVGTDSACALLADESIRCWGANGAGQLGNGTTVASGVPGAVSGVSGANAIGGGSQHRCALLDNGVRCWGKGTDRQVGDGGVVDRSTSVSTQGFVVQLRGAMPPQAPRGLTVTAAQGASATLQWSAPLHDGGSAISDYRVEFSEVGSNRWITAQRAASTATSHTVTGLGPGLAYTFRVSAINAQGVGPATVPELNGVRSLAGGSQAEAMCALKSDRTVWCWGRGDYGQLGNGVSAASRVPVRVSGIDNATAIAFGVFHACALRADQTVACWGRNGNGELGNNSLTSSSVPVVVRADSSGAPLSGVTAIALGVGFSCALLTDGAVRCWGAGNGGQMGTGTLVTSNPLPVQPAGLSGGVAAITAGGGTACARLVAGGARCWGANGFGQIGAGTTSANVTTPTAVTAATGIRSIVPGSTFACAVLSDGTVRCWGRNVESELGNGTATARELAGVAVQGLSDVRSIILNHFHACANLNDDTVRCWGRGSSGQIGDGALAGRSVPTPSKGIRGATTIATSSVTACAVVAGAVRCWGANGVGQIGDDSNDTRPLATAVVTSTTSANVAQRITGLTIAAQTGTSVLLQWDPANGNGYPITGYEVAYSGDNGATWTVVPTGGSTSPSVEITGLQIGTTYAFRVRARTANGLGRAGFHAGATSVSAGNAATCAVLISGDVQCWGLNGSGQLGEGTTTRRTLPVAPFEVGRASQVVTANQFTCALLVGGTVKCWGLGTSGQIGDGSLASISYPTTVGLPSAASALATGYGSHMCAILSGSGQVWCWGEGSDGQLGNGASVDRATPVRATGIESATSVAVGEKHTCAVVAAGAVRCWGSNASGQFGNGGTTSSATPVASSATGAEEIVAGKNHTCARLTGGTVNCWGVNGAGQVGNGTTTSPQLSPTGGGGASAVTKIAAGADHTCVLVSGGAIRCWGLNTSRQLGDNTAVNKSTAVAPSGALTSAISIAAGAVHSCAAFQDGRVRCWGTQDDGALGDNSTTQRATPVLTAEIEQSFTSAASAPGVVRSVAVSGRSGSTVSLRWLAPQRDGGSVVTDYRVEHSADGVTWTTFADGVSSVPATTVTGLNPSTGYAFRVSAINAVGTGSSELVALGGTQIAAGGGHACAIAATGAVNCWGRNAYGQIGDGTSTNAVFPVKVPDINGATSIATGGEFTCVALATGGVRCWGLGSNGQIGNGLTANAATPTAVTGIATARQVSASNASACARLGDGSVRCWGLGTSGQIGNGVANSSATPQPVSDLNGVTAIASGEVHTCAIKSPGQVWCWGRGAEGQLGNASTANSSVPVRAGSITTAIAIAAGGRTTCALLADRSVQCWGRNSAYQIADGTTTNRTSPTTVAALDQVASLALGPDFACAVFTSNAGTCWGTNSSGQLGTNDTTLRQTPAVVFGETRFSQIAAGSAFTCAVATDATVRCWGDAGTGKLGDGSVAARPRPAAVALVTRTPTAPGAPTGLAATAGNQRARLAWTAPVVDGDSPLTGYRAYVTTNQALSCTTAVGQVSNPTSCTITGLANDTAYTFAVEAINAIGTSAASTTASATPVGNAPTGADDLGNAVEAGGAANATAGADPMGNVLLNDLTPDQTAGGAGSTVVAIRTGAVKGAGAAGVVGVPLAGAYGSLTVEAGGAFTYVVDNENSAVQALRSGEVVRDYFNYTVSYGGPTDVGLVEIVITGANDAPVARDDAGSAREAGGTANDAVGEEGAGDVLTNDADVDAAASITVVSVRGGIVEGEGGAGTIGSPTAGQYGTLILRANGTYTYAVDENNADVQALAQGQTLVDGFNYTVTDGSATDSAVLRITINGANDAPTLATQGTATYVEQGAARFLGPGLSLGDVDSPTLASATVRISAGDVAGDVLSFSGDPLTTGNIAAAWSASDRRLTLTSSGATATQEQWRAAFGAVQFRNAVSDTPGTSRTISWTVSDGALESATTTTSIAITGVNDAPSLQALTLTPPENETVAFDRSDFTSRYADPEGTPLAGITIATLPVAGRLALSGQAVEEGQFVTLDEIDGLTYTPVAQDATARSFSVTASDGERASPAVDVTLAFVYVNDPPTTSSAALSTLITTPVLLGVDSFGAYADPEGVALGAVVIATLPAKGALEFRADDSTWGAVTTGQTITAAQLDAGRLRYAPAAGETGQPYTTFTYRVSDGGVQSRFAYTMTVTVTASNIAPVVNVPGAQTTPEDVALAFGSGSGNAITVVDSDSTSVTVRVSVPATKGRLSVATLTSAYVGGNNSDQIVLTGPPSEVNAALATLRYLPTANANGTAYATLSITADDRFATTGGSVVVDVTAVADAPVLTAVSALAGATEDAPYTIAYADLLAASDAVDPEGAAITFRIATLVAGTLTKNGTPVVAGTTTVGAGESVVWTPPANQVGTLRAFTVQAGDGALWSGAVAVRVTVAGADDPPASTNDTATTDEDTPLILGLGDFGAFADPEGASLAGVRITTLPTAGALQLLTAGTWAAVSAGDDVTASAIADGRLRFVPAADANGSPYATIGYRVSDGALLSAAAYVLTLDVRAVTDPPTFAPQTSAGLTDTGGYDAFANRTGTLVATSPDGAVAATFGIAGDASDVGIHTAAGRFGSLSVTRDTGAYVYIPNRDAVNRLAANGSDVFRVTATVAGGGTTTTTLTVPITAVPEAITVRPTSVSKGYGDPDPALTYVIASGTLIGDDAFGGAMERVAGEAVGTYQIDRGSLAIGSAYDVTFIPRNLTITNRRLTVTVRSATRAYGSSDPAPSFAITSGSLLEGDALTGTPGRVPGDAVGTYAYTAGTLTAGPNYEIAVAGSLEITRKTLTVTGAAVATRDYDGTRDAQVSGATLVGVEGSDDVQLADATTGTFAQAEAGSSIPVTTAMRLTGAGAGNYALTQPSLTGDITASGRALRTLTLGVVGTPAAASYALNATPPTLIATPSAGDGAITYRSSTPTVCAVDANSGVITLIAAGACSTTASIAATANHIGALSSALGFTVTAIPPAAPTITGVTGRHELLEVAFTLASTGGASATNLEYSLNGGAWTALDPAATTSPASIPGLVNGTAYAVRLRVVAPGGTSAASNAVTGTPAARTIAITTSVAPTYPFTAAPPTIAAQPSVPGGEIAYATTTPTTCLVDDATGAVSFLRTGTCGVTATVSRTASLNEATAAPETFTIAPVAPSPPTISSVTPGAGKLTVAFTQGANGGATPTNLEYSTDGGGQWTAASPATIASPFAITGLTNGTAYAVKLRMVGPGGTSGASNALSGTPSGVRTIAITSSIAANYLFNAQPPTLVATPSEAGGAITYASATTGVCTVNAGTGKVTFVSAGTCTVSAAVAASGSLNAATSASRSFQIQAVVPAEPTITAVEPSSQALTISFTPGSNGGSEVTNVEYSTNGGTTWVARSPASVTSPLTITGLTNNTAYNVQVRMLNAIGTGAATETVTETPNPPVPRTITNSGAVTTYAFDADPPTILGTPSQAGGAVTYASSTPAVCTIDQNSGAVRFVSAGTCSVTSSVAQRGVLLAATSAPTTFTITAVVPGAPAIRSIVAGDGELSVQFEVGYSGGAAITNLSYSTNGGTSWTTRSPASTTSPLLITGLVNDTTYTVQIKAINSAGESNASESVVETPVVPSARTLAITSAVAGSYAFDAVAPTLIATPSAGDGAVSYSSSTSGVCTVDATTGEVAFVTAGTCTVAASVPAVTGFVAATAPSRSFSITAVAPGAPTISAATPGNESLSVAFALGSTGGATPTNVEYSTDGGATWTTRSPASTASPLAIGGLVNGTAYSVKLRAVGPAGTGVASAGVPATPQNPNARSVSITTATAASYALNATPPTIQATPSNGGGAVTYASTTPGVCTVDASTGDVAFVAAGTCAITASVAQDGQLLPATSSPRTFAVTAIAPGAPTITTVTAGNGALTVAFALGATGGAAPTNVEYSVNGGQTWVARSPVSAASPLVIGGLQAGTAYDVRLRIVGPGGTGSPSSGASGTPFGVPGAPTGVTASASNGAATVTWSAPASANGSPITGYVVTAAPGGATCEWSSGPLNCTLVTLANGTAYTFTVQARNAAGLGAASTPSAAVTPAGPAAPAPAPATPAAPTTPGAQPPLTVGPVEVPGTPPPVREDGSTRVPVTCAATSSCTTTVAYVIGRETVASKQQVVPGGGAASLALSLPPALQDRLAQRGELRVTVVVIVETADGPVRSEREMVLEAPTAEAASNWVMVPMPNGDTSVSAICVGDRVTHCAGTIEFFLREGARARTLVARAEIKGQGGQPMTAVVPLNATGRRVLREQGSLAVDRVISMPGIAILGKVAVSGGADARIAKLTDREWLIRTLDVLMRGAAGRAALERAIAQRHDALISAKDAVRIMQRDVLPARRRTLEQVRLLPLPSARYRRAHAMLIAAVERSIETDQIYLRAFQKDDRALWTSAWLVRNDAMVGKRRLIAEFQRIGRTVGVDVPHHQGVWP